MIEIKQNILVIDDNKLNILVLRGMLAQAGYKTYESISAKEAFEKLNSQRVDLILLDIIMPEMNGIEFCKKLKQIPEFKNIPVVFLTALTDLDSIENAFNSGAVDYITKPFKSSEILARIRNHLELVSYRNDLEKLVVTRTQELENINQKLEFEIEQKNILAAELQKQKDILEETVNIRTKELQESEYNLRTIFEKSVAIMLIVDPETDIILECNETALNFYGYTADELKKKCFHEFNTMSKSELKAEIEKTISHDKNFYSTQHKISKGEIRDVEVYTISLNLKNRSILVTSIYDVTEKKQIQNKILNTIIETEEKEKQRFAKDLHDGLGPILSTAKLYLKSIEDNCKKEQNKANLQIVTKIDEIINEAISSLKEISNNLSPHILTNFGFVTAIKSVAKKIENSSQISISVTGNSEKRLERNIEMAAYRVVFELINNTLKHAQATSIEIKILITDKFLKIIYTDNGKGFDKEKIMMEKNGMGLQNIVSRVKSLNGNFEILTGIGSGFTSKIDFPVK